MQKNVIFFDFSWLLSANRQKVFQKACKKILFDEYIYFTFDVTLQ